MNVALAGELLFIAGVIIFVCTILTVPLMKVITSFFRWLFWGKTHYGRPQPGLTLNFKLKFVDDKMTLNGRFVSPKKELVMHDGEKFELGEESCINSKFEYNVFETEFKRIEGMDFTSLEDANFNALCTTNFSSKIN